MLPHAWIEGFGTKITGLDDAEISEMENGSLVGAYEDEEGELHNLLINVKKKLLKRAKLEIHPYTKGKEDHEPIGFFLEATSQNKSNEWRLCTRSFSLVWPVELKLRFTPLPERGRAPFELLPKKAKDDANYIKIQGPYYAGHPELAPPPQKTLLTPDQKMVESQFEGEEGWIVGKYEYEGDHFRVKHQRFTLLDGSIFIATAHSYESDAKMILSAFDTLMKSLKPYGEMHFFSVYCDFCSVDRTSVGKVISSGAHGTPTCICDACVSLFQEYFAEEAYDPTEFPDDHCGFCGREANKVKHFAGSLVFESNRGICDECLKSATEAIGK